MKFFSARDLHLPAQLLVVVIVVPRLNRDALEDDWRECDRCWCINRERAVRKQRRLTNLYDDSRLRCPCRDLAELLTAIRINVQDAAFPAAGKLERFLVTAEMAREDQHGAE